MSPVATNCLRGSRDLEAGRLLKELREDLGLSREAMCHAMRRQGVERDYIPSARTLQRIEDQGVRPIVRHRFGLAAFHERKQSTIWRSA